VAFNGVGCNNLFVIGFDREDRRQEPKKDPHAFTGTDGECMPDEDPERAEAIEKVKEHLSFLPGGVPNSLWGFTRDMLAEAIVNGEKRRSSAGMPLVRVDDIWYYNDPGDILTYMKEYPGD
jgi:hypothetical protein